MFMTPKNYKKLNDIEIVELYKQTNDNVLVAELFQRYSHLIFGVGMKYLKDEEHSKDICMQLFEKLLIDLKNHQINHFKSWLYMVCKNHCLMLLRSQNTSQKKEKEYANFMESAHDLHPVSENGMEMQLSLMEKCIEELNIEQKKCVELFYLKELSYQQIVDETSFNLNNVKSYIQNGKRNLKICIEKKSVEQLK